MSQRPVNEEGGSDLIFYLNGEKVLIKDVDPTTLLIDYLRSPTVGYTGTKESCGEGGCGACTVMVSHFDSHQKKVINNAVNSCLRPICSLDGKVVTTTEGIGSTRTALDPVQYRVAADNGSQCGYCTPGFVMNMYAFLQNHQKPTRQQIEDNFDGNICRCTGFRPILYAMKTFAVDHDERESEKTPRCGIDPTEEVPVKKSSKFVFPPEMKISPRALHYSRGGYEWYRPLELAEVFKLKKQYDTETNLKLVVGNTSIGVYKKDVENPHVFVDISEIESLRQLYADAAGVHIGAAITYTELLNYLNEIIAKKPHAKTAGLSELRYLAHRTAGVQVRSAASVAGNIMLVVSHVDRGSFFPSDLFTGLVALGASLTVGSAEWGDEQRRFSMLEYAAAYNSDENIRKYAVILSIDVPYTRKNEYVLTEKVARRIQNSHALVNAAFRIAFDNDQRVSDAAIVYGGITPIAFRASKTERFLNGKAWDEITLAGALKALNREIKEQVRENLKRIEEQPDEGVSLEYRHSIAEGFFYKLFLNIAMKTDPGEVSAANKSAARRYVRPVSSGRQHFNVFPDEFPVSLPMVRLAAFLQAAGEAKYTHDLALPAQGLEACYVTSERAHANFYYKQDVDDSEIGIDIDELIRITRQAFDGFKDFITVRDIPERGKKLIGIAFDDPVFCEGKATYYGQSIGLAVAETKQEAEAAARFIQEHIGYEDLPMVLSIEEARALPNYKGIFQNNPKTSPFVSHLCHIERAGSDPNWLKSKGKTLEGHKVLSGKQKTGGQVHFYMEPQGVLITPGELHALVVQPSSQDPASIQQTVAQVLALPTSNIDIRVRRLGGGFGGKTTRPPFVASAAAVAAWKLNKPVRLALERDQDTALIGKRHPFLGEYNIAYTDDGSIGGLYTSFWSEGGNTYDCSFIVLDFAQLNADNAYFITNYRTNGNVAITNKASNGAMRSFGMIQVALIQEEAIERVAHEINRKRKDGKRILPEEIRQRMLYQEREREPYQTTPYGQTIKYCYMDDVWEEMMKRSDFRKRQQQVQEFNRKNRWRKRGISMMPLKYGLGYSLGFLSQGGAMISAYSSDGSVLVQHGGVEMGQGIMTKMAQIAAEALNVPLEKIQMDETNTEVIANAISTGATSGSDLNGGAVQQAGEILRKRLEDFADDLRQFKGNDFCVENGLDYWNYDQGWKEISTVTKTLIWDNIVLQAFQNRIDLSVQTLFKTRDIVNSDDEQFVAFTYSAACSEVEIDVLTGEMNILRSDILYDAGKSLNPCIDVGQVEGAFVQGVGYVTSEELVFESKGKQKGKLNTVNTWAYKPPCSKSIPIDFRVSLYNSERKSSHGVSLNPNLILSSKGTGEPPLVLASTVFFAIKHAILAARRDAGRDEWFELESPATVERIQQACAVGRDQLKL
jgi:xanthine dehydrogenase/oxidase